MSSATECSGYLSLIALNRLHFASFKPGYSYLLTSHLETRALSLPQGIHNPGELKLIQLERYQPGGICHVESFVLGSLRKPAS